MKPWINAKALLVMSLALLNLPSETAKAEALWGLALARTPIVRSMSQWVEDELILPSGPFVGERYKHSRHPASRLWFNAVDSGQWTRFAATGPTQNGKSLMCYVAPVCYQLFEIGETVIIGLPNMDMANDKWQQDFKPVIEASRYRDLLPLKGEGSRGGQVKRAITFRNGATLRFMSGGGNDKKRAGYTSRVVAITETDGMDESGEVSREADKIEQIEGRTRAFGRTGKRVFLECTVSIERGRIWQEIKNGTDSKIARACPHCNAYVTPEREHLVGWEDAESEEAAARSASWSCPACGELWSEADRAAAADTAMLVHKGQEVIEGKITGPIPETQTLGFRWSAIDNPFVTAADLGAEEWKAKHADNKENAEKKQRQFVWTIPYEPPDVELTPLDPSEVAARSGTHKRREVPDECVDIAIGIDTGKKELNWEAKAIAPDGSKLHVIEYGEQPVDANRYGVRKGLIIAFRKLHKYLEEGWDTKDGRHRTPSQVWIDSGYHEHTNAVYALCAEVNGNTPPEQWRYRPAKGYGEGQKRMTPYRAPQDGNDDVLYVGNEYHIRYPRRKGKRVPGVLLVHVNADHWKSEFHQRLAMPPEEHGAVILYGVPDPEEHEEYSQQVTAERQLQKYLPGKGEVTIWERVRRNNHKLDAGYLATAAADFVLQLRNIPAPVKSKSLAQLAAEAKGR